LAFKDNTDDTRESPALTIIDELTKAGATVVAYDPQAMDHVKRQMADNTLLKFADDAYGALKVADALIIATNWSEFMAPDFAKVKQLLATATIFDGRNLYEPQELKAAGFHYESIGRKAVN